MKGLGNCPIDDLTAGPQRDTAAHLAEPYKGGPYKPDSTIVPGDSFRALIDEIDPIKTDAAKSNKYFLDTKVLDSCISQAENLTDMLHSEVMALKIVGMLSFGLRKSGELLADAIYKQKQAKAEVKRAQGIAALETFGSYIREKKEDGIEVKMTDSTRGHYINIDEDVLRSLEKEALCEAIVAQLDTYKTQFTMAMSAVKAMISKQRSDSLISGIDSSTDCTTEKEI
jgi:hypothetical protein